MMIAKYNQPDIMEIQGGPLPAISGVLTPISRAITPATHFFLVQ